MEKNFTKVKEVFFHSSPRNNKVLHFMQKCYDLKEMPKIQLLDNLNSRQIFRGLEQVLLVLKDSIV